MGPEGVLVAEDLAAVEAQSLLLGRVSDLEVLLEVGTVADQFVAHWAWTCLVWVVLCGENTAILTSEILYRTLSNAASNINNAQAKI